MRKPDGADHPWHSVVDLCGVDKEDGQRAGRIQHRRKRSFEILVQQRILRSTGQHFLERVRAVVKGNVKRNQMPDHVRTQQAGQREGEEISLEELIRMNAEFISPDLSLMRSFQQTVESAIADGTTGRSCNAEDVILETIGGINLITGILEVTKHGARPLTRSRCSAI